MGHVNAHSCLLINFQYIPISLPYSSLSVEQPIKLTECYIIVSLGISNK